MPRRSAVAKIRRVNSWPPSPQSAPAQPVARMKYWRIRARDPETNGAANEVPEAMSKPAPGGR